MKPRSTPPDPDASSPDRYPGPDRTHRRSDTMHHHEPDRTALVFGVLFTTFAAAALARLSDVVDVDAGVALGGGLVVAAVLVIALTIGPREPAPTPRASDRSDPDTSSVSTQ